MSDNDHDLRAEVVRLQQQIDELRRGAMSSVARNHDVGLEEIDPVFRAGPQRALRVPGSQTRGFKRHIIIPVHPPRFGAVVNAFANARCDEASAQDILLVLLVTSEAERHVLANYLKLTGASFPVETEIVSAIGICESLDLPQTISAIKENRLSGIVNFKKLAAIYRSVCLGTEEMVVIDSDVVIFGDIAEIFVRLGRNFEKKEIVAGKGPGNIFKDAAEHLLLRDKNRVFQFFDGGNLYSWFFDAPYYPLAEAKSWLAHMAESHGSVDAALSHLTYGTFEHLLFHFHLALRCGFQVLDVRPLVGDWHLEDLPLPELLRIIDGTGHIPTWANLGGIITHSGPEEVERARDMFLIAMHVDRAPSRMD